jgi:ElaB/YqjD/DUF883 family membrane-anchored ribosome-binding protein
LNEQGTAAYKQANQQIDQARQDLTPLVSAARTNFEQFGETAKAELERLSEPTTNSSSNAGFMIGADGTPFSIDPVDTAIPAETTTEGKGKGVDRTVEGEGNGERSYNVDEQLTATAEATAAAATAFFNKLQTQISSSSNIQELQKLTTTLQSNLSHLPASLSHIPSSLQTNLTTLSTQLQKAETDANEFIHKGENWLNELSHEVQKLAKEAIKVVPGDKGLARREERLRNAEQVAVGRKETLVQRLRSDPEILLLDPARFDPTPLTPSSSSLGIESPATPVKSNTTDRPLSPSPLAASSPDTRAAFSTFLTKLETSGGLEGEEFNAMIAKELEAAVGSTLSATYSKLVPSELAKEAFWSRYFFRMGQIEEDGT